ncbi:MAG: MBL fold metallo-hydrolase [Bacteroidia bacterium]
MKLTFWGAARQVTGSMHLLTLNSGYSILIDCGLDYENREDFDANNKNFPFLPEEIDLVVLTHAHIDHSGNLPNLIRQGYSGQILCSRATVDLTKNLLIDSLNVQKIEGQRKQSKNNRKRVIRKSKAEQVATLYNRVHIDMTHDAMVSLDYYKPFKINDEVTIELYEAGHILGASSVKFTVQENGKTSCIGFTGDLGNNNSKLVKDPVPMKDLDYLVSESTYGGRSHTQIGDAEQILLDFINNTCVKFNGKLVIPAFSVGRTQSIIFALNQLYVKGLLPKVNFFTFCPFEIKTTRLYAEHVADLNDEAKAFFKENGNLFSFPGLYTIEESSDSKMISMMPEPAVIISAAGMVEGGRIQEHVRHNIGDAYSTVLIAGFCAEGTLGAELLKGKPTVKISKRIRQVYAKIARTDVFSAHLDRDGLLKYFEDSNLPKLKKLFLVHGDYSSMVDLKSYIKHEGVMTPELGEEFIL